MPVDIAAFAIAQPVVVKGDIAANVARHVVLAEAAARHGARLVLLPELALTGYEPALAAGLALDADDPRLAPLRHAAMRLGIVLVTGAPWKTSGLPRIAALSFLPGGTMQVYTKQHLHPGEEAAFAVGEGGAGLVAGDARIALAVCAEIAHAQHPAAAALAGADLYAASVLVSENGYEHDAGLLRGYARQYGMPVAMANHGGPTGGWSCAGRSALWDETGQPVIAADGVGECLLLAERERGRWRGWHAGIGG
ncbi:carbon-nitrogen hydrolase family protein [Massilia dura]|uniref:Carbon-nitrogen hydrolase family protein n=1 Tax=Pseudoduganella dura TaxID=321982 RepID=A0A6I3XFH2_9BURK|nr:carbon-nitrogen hydrolase family protein [Pseudoduganella dura]MUI12012.1 carbon-nitrogen hydrolase family protein [Pseudoduganella dura]GGX82718.1 carbon-nitrogen hydrolase family protein [Pseudoduganella dura]